MLLAKLDGFGTNRGIIWLKLVLQMSKSFVPHKLALVLLGCHLCGKLPPLGETFSCHTGISQHGCGKKWMMDGPQEFLPSIELQNDLGFHCWKPPRNPWKVHRELKRRNVTADEIKRGSVVDQPLRCQLVDVKKLRFPMIFKDPSELRRQFADGSYPFLGGMISSLYVACGHKGLSPDDIDFLIDDSILHFFAGRGKRKKYLAQRCPGTKITVIGLHRDYVSNFGEKGYQFERLLTNQDMYGFHQLEVHEHLRLLRIAGFNVLVAGEVDAVDSDGKAVEFKAQKKINYQQVFLQMVSNSARVLLYPATQPRVTAIDKLSLQEIASTLGAAYLEKVSARIACAFEEASKLLIDAPNDCDQTWNILHQDDGTLSLQPADPKVALLPPKEVVRALLQASRSEEKNTGAAAIYLLRLCRMCI